MVAYVVLVLVVLAVSLSHWPGRLDSDTLATIAEVRTGRIGNQRSVFFTWLWSAAFRLTGAGPGPVLVVQSTALVVGLYLVLRAAFGRVVAAGLSAVMVASPPVVGFVGLVGRDAWFVASCLLASGALVGAARWDGCRQRAAFAGVAAATLSAASARQNGVTAVLPVIGFAVVLALRTGPSGAWLATRARGLPWRVGVVSGVIGAAGVLAITTATATLVRDGDDHPRLYTQLYDLGWLTARLDQRLLPRVSREALPVQEPDEVRRRWLPTTSLYMRWNPDLPLSSASAPRPLTGAEARAVAASWKGAVLRHPGTYLRGRFGLWMRQLGIGHAPWYAMAAASSRDPWGYHRPAHPRLSAAVARYAHRWGAGGEASSLTGGAVHHAWIYLAVCLGGVWLLVASARPARRAAAALPASALGLQVGLFFAAPSVQWRYELLTVYAALVVIAIGVGSLIDTGRRAIVRPPVRRFASREARPFHGDPDRVGL